MRPAEEGFVDVCDAAEIEADVPLLVSAERTGSVDAVLFRVEDELYATDDLCTHAEASLADGWQEGAILECPLHLSKFDVRTGAPLTPPATSAVRCWRVRLTGSRVLIAAPEAASEHNSDGGP